ncbi:hypothetical protein CMU25_19175 [Elizabethkingia anophelis]|nr:hypothetical protein [Elizabethkingia anophelis]MDV3842443.1 hypothetical protein [Elizabethkingia anophelis]
MPELNLLLLNILWQLVFIIILSTKAFQPSPQQQQQQQQQQQPSNPFKKDCHKQFYIGDTPSNS